MSFESLQASMDRNDIYLACAVSMPNDTNLDPVKFYQHACASGRFFPVAPVTVLSEIDQEVQNYSRIGYRAIKVHPRLLGTDFDSNKLRQILASAQKHDMAVFYCTYQVPYFQGREGYLSNDHLVDSLARYPEVKVVLLHGGAYDVMRYAELVRRNENLLLDLSFTLLRYHGSSLDRDFSYLFRTLDQRICIGSDAPDFSQEQLRRRFAEIEEGLSATKAENIAHRNLARFLGVSDES